MKTLKLSAMLTLPVTVALAVPVLAGRVPPWAVGTFTGFGGSNRVQVELVVEGNGSVTMRSWRDGQQLESRGSMSDTRIDFSRESYYVSRRGSGIRITRASNTHDSVDLRRSSTFPGGGGSVPSWAVGTFAGRNSEGIPVELRIDANGAAVMYSWPGGNQRRSTGSYRNGMLKFPGASFTVSQLGANIRMTTVGDRSRYADLFRSAGSGGSGGSGGFGGSGGTGVPPSWAIGTFRGHGGSNNADIHLEIAEDGNVVMRSWRPDGTQFESRGRYQNGRLVFHENSYYIARRGSHIRISLVSNPRDYVDLDR